MKEQMNYKHHDVIDWGAHDLTHVHTNLFNVGACAISMIILYHYRLYQGFTKPIKSCI